MSDNILTLSSKVADVSIVRSLSVKPKDTGYLFVACGTLHDSGRAITVYREQNSNAFCFKDEPLDPKAKGAIKSERVAGVTLREALHLFSFVAGLNIKVTHKLGDDKGVFFDQWKVDTSNVTLNRESVACRRAASRLKGHLVDLFATGLDTLTPA